MGEFQVFLYASRGAGSVGMPSEETNTFKDEQIMPRAKVSDEEWRMFLSIADRLQIPIRETMEGGMRFSAIEAAGHRFGRAVAQITTERLALLQAEQLTEMQPCPTCGRQCPPVHHDREFETIDGPVELGEPVCQCSACRRAFFPSASPAWN